MTSWLLFAVLLLPIMTAALLMFVGRRLARARFVSLLGTLGFAGISVWAAVVTHRGVTLTTAIGSWPLPFGIALHLDAWSGAMLAVSGLVAVAVALYQFLQPPAKFEGRNSYALQQALLLGVAGAFVTADLFNLYVWFEVLLMASFALLVVGGGRAALRASIAYVTINLAASACLLLGIGLAFGATGTLNMADLAQRLSDVPTLTKNTIAALLLVAFATKAAAFPFFFWLPASYPTLPAPLSALFAGLLTKVGIYSLLRVFPLLFAEEWESIAPVILVVAVATMVFGVLGAYAQTTIRDVLSFHIVSQIGYMLLGLGLGTVAGLSAAVFYAIHHIVVKSSLFLVAGLVVKAAGTDDLRRMGSLAKERPWLALLFAIPAMSLAGLPPLSGFWAKLFVIDAAFEAQAYVPVLAALGVGLLTLMSMVKLWIKVFWEPSSDEAQRADSGRAVQARVAREPAVRGLAARGSAYASVLLLALVTLWISFMPASLYGVSQTAAQQLGNPAAYVQRVLGGQP